MENKPDLPYDYEDLGMTKEELEVKYPLGHPEYSIEKWEVIEEFASNQNDYWDWVLSQISKDDDLY